MGIQYVATVTDPGIVDEDVRLAVTFQDLLRSSVHRVCVSQVEDDGAGSVRLVGEQYRTVYCSSCFDLRKKTVSLFMEIRGKF